MYFSSKLLVIVHNIFNNCSFLSLSFSDLMGGNQSISASSIIMEGDRLRENRKRQFDDAIKQSEVGDSSDNGKKIISGKA